MEGLKKKRKSITQRMTKLCNKIESFSQANDNQEVLVRAQKLDEIFKEYENVQSEIEELDENESINRDAYEDRYFHIKTLIHKCSQVPSVAPLEPNSSTPPAHSQKATLPEIKLPVFGGEIQDWLFFSDMFVGLVDKDSSIPDILKFHYLRTSLKDEALHVIQNLELSAENYLAAWKLLKDRYDNKRLIIHSHLKSLFELTPLTAENHNQFHQFIDGINKHRRALEILKEPVNEWDTVLIHLFTNKFNFSTRKEWESKVAHKKPDEMPKLEELIEFLNHKCQTLELVDKGKAKIENQKPQSTKKTERQVSLSTFTNKCIKCKNSHPIFKCEEFLNLSPKERIQDAKKLHLCLNCLRLGHLIKDCKSSKCQKCKRQHNTLLHVEEVEPKEKTSEVPVSPSMNSTINNSQIILPTALVVVLDKKNNKHFCRTLLDSGSQANFITKSFFDKLNLPKHEFTIDIRGISQSSTKIKNKARITINSRINNFKTTLDFFIINQITENLPAMSLNQSGCDIPTNICLADPEFLNSKEIDMLLGAEIFYDLQCSQQIKSNNNSYIFQKTKLGWVVSGKFSPFTSNHKTPLNTHFCTSDYESRIDEDLKRFWTLEECNTNSKFSSPEQRKCEEIFISTTNRDLSGRFIVMLPTNDKIHQLGDSEENALRRFSSLEKRLQKNTDLKEEYVKFMKEYEALGHMEVVNEPTETNTPIYYLPHHAVVKDTSLTTKIRVVFDGSCKTTSGISLNDCLLVGPIIQDDVFTILMRFRCHLYVLTADIVKMYRQIRVQEEQTDLQRIFWRESIDQPLKSYRLRTVTYGTAPAPFLAIRSLQELAVQKSLINSETHTALMKDFYVDDLLTGCNSLTQLKSIRNNLIQVLKKGGFELNKWASNHDELLDDISDVCTNSVLILDKNDTIKTLGLLWNPSNDSFHYQTVMTDHKEITKRNLLSMIAQIFDPLGLLGPIIIIAKLMIQKLWSLQLDWDQQIPSDLQESWKMFAQQMKSLHQIQVPRHVLSSKHALHIQIHGFSDASERAYGACIYLRVTDDSQNNQIRLLCSKSRVAPIKKTTIPRLELCAAQLLARLYKKVKTSLNIEIKESFLWSDSTITLHWISQSPDNWKTFIANRVAEIQELTQPTQWGHVPSHQNPADLLSRGCSATSLIDNNLWWSGPEWLISNNWPTQSTKINFEPTLLESKPASSAFLTTQPLDLLRRFSSFNKLTRIFAYLLRFITNAKTHRQDGKAASIQDIKPLTIEEINNAIKRIIQLVQEEAFSTELQDLKKKNCVDKKSRLHQLHPFLDKDNIIRVGGRLRHSDVSYDQKHPAVLPTDHHVTITIVRERHQELKHCGIEQLLATIRLKYWPLSGRRLIRKIIRSCIPCFKVNPKKSDHLMGDLPKGRVIMPARPFLITGIDYAGPILVKEGRCRRGRSRLEPQKAYIAVFVCFATKACHLELVSDLTSEKFLDALRRFTARRGLPAEIYTDNGTNFVGANRQLQEFYEFLSNQNNIIASELAKLQIKWSFIPPRSPHFGGLWESTVKSMKRHFYKVTQDLILTFEETQTLLTGIEACLNSRPITAVSSDPNDLSFLSPSHFLIGDILIEPLEHEYAQSQIKKTSLLSRWQHIQQVRRHFWQRFQREYLHQLQGRSKWATSSPNIQEGTLVLLIEDNLPPLKWIAGRVITVHPGQDGVVRVVSVKTNSGVYKRSVRKVCVVPIDNLNT